MPVRLTDTAISKASKEVAVGIRRDLADGGCPGLRLRLTPAGGKSWVLACRDRLGRMRRFPVGTYPAMGISEARDAARALHVKVKHEGADPVAQRRKERAIGDAARAGVGTLKAVLDLYGQKRGDAQKAWADARKRIDLIFKPLLERPATMLVASEFQLLADSYPSASSASFAVRSLRPALKWAEKREYLSADATRIHPPATVKRRQRVLTADELKALLPVLKASDKPAATAIRFMLLTLARRDEVCSAKWCDIDLEKGFWMIPETKNGEPHQVPLSRQAKALLLERWASAHTPKAIARSSGKNIPGQRKHRPRTGQHDTLHAQAALKREPEPSDLVFATGNGGTLKNWDRDTKALMKLSKTEGWTRHDLRRTGATMLGELGELPDIIEAALNHVSIRSALAATYNRSRYRPQVAMALQRLADALDGIETGGAEIIPLHAG